MEDTVSKATSIAVNAIKKDKFLSVAIIVSMIATFLILGSFITTFVFTQTAVKSLENEVMVSVYFKDDFSTQSILNLKEKLSKDVRISDVRYVSKEDAFKIFTLLNKGDKLLLESVTASILPASLELKAVNISDIETIATEMRKESGVEDVRFFKDAVNRFKMWSSIVNIVGLTVVGVFLFISFSIIVIALRLTISAKGVEISILRLVGASEDYVKKPLVAQAVMYSLLSSFIAFVLLFITLNFLVFEPLFRGEKLTILSYIPSLQIGSFLYSVVLGIFMLLSSLILGILGSTTAIKKYLKL
ncbi:MAG: hypothetical protein RLY61_245 [Candidatus Parcubacteria bacterium]